MKRIFCLFLTIVMLSSLACTAVSAKESEQKTYRYVALGDSISAGFGLENESGNFIEDPALFLTEDLIADPVRSAYPALFGEKLAALGAENGYEVIATNLSTSGYLAEDVEKTILMDGHQGYLLDGIFALMGDVEENPMDNYHEIFSQYIDKADLVSILLGGNDIIFKFFESMGNTGNPILEAVRISVLMSLLGMDIQTCIDTGKQMIKAARNDITCKTVREAAATIKALVKSLDECIDEAADGVGRIIDAVRTVNETADFAVIGMYNPYGNSLKLNEQTQNVMNIVRDIIVSSADYISGLDKKTSRKTVVAELKKIVKSELTYPLQYLSAGKTMDKAIRKLNSDLEKVAKSKGAVYVDVYNISNECNFDPHPDANGHQEIADILESELHDLVCEGMEADRIPLPLENTSTISAASVTAGTKVTITGAAEGGSGEFLYTYQIKKPGNSSWTTLGEKYGTATSKVFTAKLEGTYEVRVLVKDGTGTVKSFKTTVNSTGSILKNNSTISATTANVGEKVTLTAVAEGGTEPYRYTYEYKKPGDTKFKTIGKRGAQYPSVQFSIEIAGTYEAKVYIQDDTDYTTVKTFTVEVPELE